jgi:hypothetical protein
MIANMWTVVVERCIYDDAKQSATDRLLKCVPRDGNSVASSAFRRGENSDKVESRISHYTTVR